MNLKEYFLTKILNNRVGFDIYVTDNFDNIIDRSIEEQLINPISDHSIKIKYNNYKLELSTSGYDISIDSTVIPKHNREFLNYIDILDRTRKIEEFLL